MYRTTKTFTLCGYSSSLARASNEWCPAVDHPRNRRASFLWVDRLNQSKRSEQHTLAQPLCVNAMIDSPVFPDKHRIAEVTVMKFLDEVPPQQFQHGSGEFSGRPPIPRPSQLPFSPRNSCADVSELPTSGGQRPALQVSALSLLDAWPAGFAVER
ncbi:UNVERIFIED_CONTAM: hypothetical protein FKN15_011580 [Acipenser sinensis]